MGGDKYYSTFYDKQTSERVSFDVDIDDYLYEGQTLFLKDGSKYRIVSIYVRESEYQDPYDGHDVDRDYYQSVYVEKIE